MGTLKRAWLFLARKRGRAAILLLILTVVAALVLTCISIGRAADLASEELRETMGGYFKVRPNYEGSGVIGTVDDGLIRSIMDLGGIRAYNGMDVDYMVLSELTLTAGRFALEGGEMAHLSRFLGNTDTSLHEYFVLKTFTLVDGSHVSEGEGFRAVISDSLAAANGLAVGDTFSASFMERYYGDAAEGEHRSFDFEVAGIFEITSEFGQSDKNSAECDIQDNFVFTTTDAMREMYSALRPQPS